MKKLTTIILAAGKGTRMNSSLSKVLHPIANQPMLSHIIDKSEKLKSNKIIVVVNETFNIPKKKPNSKIIYVVQNQQLGTGDAIKVCLKNIDKVNNRVLILYADVPLINNSTLRKLIKLRTKNEIKILAFKKLEKNNYGKLIIQNSVVEKIIEAKEFKTDNQPDDCNSGVFCASAEGLLKLIPKIKNNNVKKEYYLTDFFGLAFNSKYHTKVVYGSEEEFMGINNKVELAQAEKIMQNKLRVKFLKQGVTLIDPETVYFSKDTKIGKDVTIYPNVFIGPKVSIGSNTTIHPFTHLDDCKIGKNVNIGPNARVRPGSDISDDARIGNFVEIKKSKIGKGSKVNHLAYVGDAILGKNVNIGAGTITCNYDGKNKHITQIGDNAFIGSNSSLVAPLKIEKDAYIGSGSVITKDVSKGALAMERSHQTEIKNWSKRLKRK
jgi:bifunctional UDP-N-acetylglucosamine pyrophosphorylase/glucosamine-1-phosphate N-acetyltransferase